MMPMTTPAAAMQKFGLGSLCLDSTSIEPQKFERGLDGGGTRVGDLRIWPSGIRSVEKAGDHETSSNQHFNLPHLPPHVFLFFLPPVTSTLPLSTIDLPLHSLRR